MKDKTKTYKKKFSLIELLVVTAIISILLTLTIPVIQNTLELARRIVCINQIKNVGKANHLFSDDFNNFAPAKIPRGAGMSGVFSFWTHEVPKSEVYDRFESHGILAHLEYINPNSFYCPSWQNNVLETSYHASATFNGTTFKGNYGKIGGWPSKESQWAESPDEQNWQWIRQNYHYRQSFSDESAKDNYSGSHFRGPSILRDDPDQAYLADHFTHMQNVHHYTGFNLLFIDNSARYFEDSNLTIKLMNHGLPYQGDGNGGLHGNKAYKLQEKAWLHMSNN